jgi:hypothetical protein
MDWKLKFTITDGIHKLQNQLLNITIRLVGLWPALLFFLNYIIT